MVKAVIFDMFETLVTHYNCKLYFGNQMAIDAKMDTFKFHEMWDLTDDDRTLGNVTLEEVLTNIFKANGVYTDELLARIVEKRINVKKKVFINIEPAIIDMLEELKKRNIKIGLISNCFSEEVEVIRNSTLAKYFNNIVLSYEKGVKKPDRKIYEIALNELEVEASDCIFVGDGGSDELAGAKNVGIRPLQAGWFLRQSGYLFERRRAEFPLLNKPNDLFRYLGE